MHLIWILNGELELLSNFIIKYYLFTDCIYYYSTICSKRNTGKSFLEYYVDIQDTYLFINLILIYIYLFKNIIPIMESMIEIDCK